ncbi:MAG: glycogen phosphorylase, partial [Fimbriimonadaceae bacterium]|nr:glycogen phosphorylase [Fimbriimonadaceae bacterium]
MKHPKLSHAFEVVAELPEPLKPLRKLAENFRWTWHHDTRELFKAIDKELWEAVDHNPIRLISETPSERLAKLAADPSFLGKLQSCSGSLDQYLSAETWFDQTYPGARDKTTVAYFCAEFGVSESLPIYSGGLGVLAGDHLKAASDLGVPLVGVGLLYARGYFRQRLTPDGWQQEIYPQYDFYQMPLKLSRDASGQPIRIEVELPDRMVTCQLWRAEVGRVPLYLLDSNVLENEPTDQGITDTLYGGDEEMRIRQEIILGVGGMKALRALGIAPTVCHMNEGHAAFLSIERIRGFMKDHGCDFTTARQVVRNGNVFTTHTPVPAGFDLFPPEMLERYMAKTVADTGLAMHDFLGMGRIDPENEGEAFNMAVLAMKNSNHVNAVSELHAKVTQGMFKPLWPDYPEDEVPIEAITNGVHTMTWVSRRFAELFDESLGSQWRREPQNPAAWEGVDTIPDDELWATIENGRADLVRFVRKRLQRDLERRQMSRADFGALGTVLDPRVLTVGFARRFATYKRASLMLADKERLLKLLFHAERPIQIVLAGKSHPRDDGGKKLIQEINRFIENEGGLTRIVFLEDYDMAVARAMVQGVDLWLNNPRRPQEASGTSGMKVVPNGGLNCSILDGWWDEGCDAEYGWAIGDRSQPYDEAQQDWLDSKALYGLLEHEIAPRFYHRVDNGLPSAWLQMVKKSIKALAPQFSTARMVRDYTSKSYMPAALRYTRLQEDSLQAAREALEYKQRVQAAWPQVRIEKVTHSNGEVLRVGGEMCVTTEVILGSLSPDEVCVEAVVGKIGPNRDLVDTESVEMKYTGASSFAHLFEATIHCERPGYQGYTVRVLPRND